MANKIRADMNHLASAAERLAKELIHGGDYTNPEQWVSFWADKWNQIAQIADDATQQIEMVQIGIDNLQELTK